MIRDMDLIRQLMLKLEAFPIGSGGTYLFSYDDFDSNGELFIEGYSPEEIEYHLNLIDQAELIRSGVEYSSVNGIMFKSVSWQGHDFVDSIRDAKVWEKTREGALNAGGFTFDLLKDLAKGYIKKQIEEKTGVSL